MNLLNENNANKDFIKVLDVYEGQYEWYSVTAYYSPSRDRFFWISECGCSCDWPEGQNNPMHEFKDGTYDDLKRNLSEEFKSGWSKETVATWKHDLTSNVNKLRHSTM